MIIKKVIIQNYLCYYGIKEFELANGLNIILGENGEGKTKFYEALDWLFNGDHRGLEKLVSAKALAEAKVSDQVLVRVSIIVEQYNEKKTISKSFIAKKTGDGECTAHNYSLEAIEETKSGERSRVDGAMLLETIFPNTIRRYSSFKGESELNIFRNDDALINLINSFSSAKYYEKYSEKGQFLREKAEKAVDDVTRSDKKNQNEYRRLESEISRLLNERERINVFIRSIEEQISKTENFIQEAEKYVTNAEALETINGRISNIENQIINISSRINEKYTTALFDEKWILVNFERFHHEFSTKVTEIANKKRELQTAFDRELGFKKGKKHMKSEILNNSIPLPIGVPSKAHMEEMIRDQVCKVCNRPAKKGTEEYKFMLKRLEEYLKSQEPEELENEERKVLFKNDFTTRLFNLAVSHEDNLANLRGVRSSIEDLFEFNKELKEQLVDLQDKLEKEFGEREKIIGNSTIGEEKLGSVLKNYNSWRRDLTNYDRDLNFNKSRLTQIEDELNHNKVEKEKIDLKSASGFLIKTREILRDIELIFNDTKERKFDEFINKLQEKSNRIFEEINVEAFTGTIVFNKKHSAGKIAVKIELQEADGRVFYMPNQSLLTSMHISILFAISELATEAREESYPMIFDAPTSSFGETKTTQFLNMIFKNSNQKILLIKDFLTINEKTKKLGVKNEFASVKRNKAFWIFLERPFDKKDLKTLNTQVITL